MNKSTESKESQKTFKNKQENETKAMQLLFYICYINDDKKLKEMPIMNWLG